MQLGGSAAVAIVTTTINVPVFLESYLRNIAAHGHSDVLVVVVGDLRTPPETGEYVGTLRRRGLDAFYLGPDRQRRWLKDQPELAKLLPWNSVQRRNLGYLWAAEHGARIVISVDDDNYAVDEEDFVGHHSIVGTVQDLDVVSADNQWLNVCDFVTAEPDVRFVPRGFLNRHRHDRPELARRRERRAVAVNAGLWLGEPDVDAVTRLALPLTVTGLRRGIEFPVGLAAGTWCPVNSQNTAFDVNALPCAYLIVMGSRYQGMRLDRYCDIWMGYLAKPVLDALGAVVAYGHPLVRQDRNVHDVLRDLAGELPGMMLTESLWEFLRSVKVTGSGYLRAYYALAEALSSGLAAFPAADRRVFARVADGMRVWVDACGRAGIRDAVPGGR